MELIVKKLGGENAACLYMSSQNILEDHKKWNKQIVVVSAMRSSEVNTTDYLIKIGQWLSEDQADRDKIFWYIQILEDFHIWIVSHKVPNISDSVLEIVHAEFSEFKEIIDQYLLSSKNTIIPTSQNDYSIEWKNKQDFSIIGFWEVLSSKILATIIWFLGDDSVSTQSIDLSHIVSTGDISWKKESEVFKILEDKIYTKTHSVLESGFIPVLPGYIWVFEWWIQTVIWRWYTDATAAICIVGFAHKWYEWVLEIQKSVRWVLSADPRMLYNSDSAHLIPQMDYVTAREITGDCWANAKLLHSQAIRAEVQDAGVRIHLFDPFCQMKSEGTWVVPSVNESEWNKESHLFVWGRKNIIFFSVSSGKMFEAWILANIFTIVQKYFSVDIISASETEVSFTIDGSADIQKKLDELEAELRIACNIPENSHMEFIEYRPNKALVFCVGQYMKDHIWLLSKASTILAKNDINIEIVSQGRLQRAMVFWIDEVDMQKAINVLHDEFIGNIS